MIGKTFQNEQTEPDGVRVYSERLGLFAVKGI